MKLCNKILKKSVDKVETELHNDDTELQNSIRIWRDKPMNEHEEKIQKLPDLVYEMYQLTDEYANSKTRTQEQWDEIRNKQILINNLILSMM